MQKFGGIEEMSERRIRETFVSHQNLRVLPATGPAVKDTAADLTISGLASSFDSIVNSALGGPTVILPGAFKKTIAQRGHVIPLLFSHNSENFFPLGKVLDLYESNRGLEFTALFAENDPVSARVLNLVNQGVLTDVSIAFESLVDKQGTLRDGTKGRLIRELRLYEISITNWGADEAAKIESAPGVDFQQQKFSTTLLKASIRLAQEKIRET